MCGDPHPTANVLVRRALTSAEKPNPRLREVASDPNTVYASRFAALRLLDQDCLKVSRATPQMRDIAERLVAYETRGNKASGTKTPAAFHISEKLRPHLATLMGDTGFRSLLSRSLALANAEVPWLRVVHVKADGSLEELEALEAQVAPEEFFEGGVVLIAHLLGLLVAFIGGALTLQLVREIWPKMSFDDLNFR